MGSTSTARNTSRVETLRLKRLANIEEEVRREGFERIAGVDEAGRGPLAGPLVAAACVLPAGYRLTKIDDSKKLSREVRLKLYQELVIHAEIDFGIGIVEAAEIDMLNIHVATLTAMARATRRLSKSPHFLLVDGRFLPEIEIPGIALIAGDSKAQAIAAASIIAKVTRDHIMMGYDELYPGYGFKEHMGYGTKKHLEALEEKGPTLIHRRSFGSKVVADD